MGKKKGKRMNKYNVTLSMLMHVMVCGFPIPFLQLSSVGRVLWSCYDLVVFMFSLYVTVCSVYSIGVRATFQDLCTLGIVFSQMTNGILITVHYLVFQRRMDSAMLHMDSITERVLSSPLGHRDIFVETFSRDRNLITLFTKTSIFFNCIASVLYCLPMPLMDLLGGRYRERIPIPIIFFGLRGDRLPIIYEIVIVLEVFVLIYSSIKKIGNDCIFLSFFKIQSAYLKYLTVTMRTLGEEVSAQGGSVMEEKLPHWIHLHQDVIRSIHELVSLYAPIIVLYYTNLICIIAFGLFVQLKVDDTDMIQSWATALWIGTLIFVLYLQSAVSDELREESDKLANETYMVPWHLMKRDVVSSLRLVILQANHPIHITAYRATSFILNKETFLGFIANVISVYVGFSKIDDILNESSS